MAELRYSTQTGSRAEIDPGLRAYMLRVYNYMLAGLALTGAVAWATAPTGVDPLWWRQRLGTVREFARYLALGSGALAAGGEHVQLLRYGKPEVALPYAEFKAEGNLRRYDGAKDSNKLAVRFEKTLCRDTAANAIFAWSALVNLNGQTLKGCAWQR